LNDASSYQRKQIDNLRKCGAGLSKLFDCLLNTGNCGKDGTQKMSTVPNMVTCDPKKLSGNVAKDVEGAWDPLTGNIYINCDRFKGDEKDLEATLFHELIHVCMGCLGYGNPKGINSEMDTYLLTRIIFGYDPTHYDLSANSTDQSSIDFKTKIINESKIIAPGKSGIGGLYYGNFFQWNFITGETFCR
jgi:hypothetical protein